MANRRRLIAENKKLDIHTKTEYNYTILKTSQTFIILFTDAAPKMLPFTRKLFFYNGGTVQKTSINPYSDCVYGTNRKITKKRKKLPFGNFSAQNLWLV